MYVCVCAALVTATVSSDSNLDSADDWEHVHTPHSVARVTRSKEVEVALSSNSSTPSSSVSSLTVVMPVGVAESGGVSSETGTGSMPVVLKRGRGRPKKKPSPGVVGSKVRSVHGIEWVEGGIPYWVWLCGWI